MAQRVQRHVLAPRRLARRRVQPLVRPQPQPGLAQRVAVVVGDDRVVAATAGGELPVAQLARGDGRHVDDARARRATLGRVATDRERGHLARAVETRPRHLPDLDRPQPQVAAEQRHGAPATVE